MPSAGFGGQYAHEDLFEMAAAYLFHIAKNHPFLDGNKRVGAVTAIVFLTLNDVEVEVDENTLEKVVLDVAEGNWNKTKIACFFRTHSRSEFTL